MARRSILSSAARPPRSRVDQSAVEVDPTVNDPASGVTTGETVVLGRQPSEAATPPPAPEE